MSKLIGSLVIVFVFTIAANGQCDNPFPSQSFAKISSLITNGIVLGEALALGVGMYALQKGNSPWLTPSNQIMLGLDVITGAGLLYLSLSQPNYYINNWFYILAGASFLAHVWRNVEYFQGGKNPFCGNVPLLVVNNIKLLGLCAVIGGGMYLRYIIKI